MNNWLVKVVNDKIKSLLKKINKLENKAIENE